jgi:hypothetical protein
METDNNVNKRDTVSRLSSLQKSILSYLQKTPRYNQSATIKGIPGTGDIIDAIGRQRNPATYAAVSKALRRLEDRGLVSSCMPGLAVQGKGLKYFLTDGCPVTGRGMPVIIIGGRKRSAKVPRHHMTIDG